MQNEKSTLVESETKEFISLISKMTEKERQQIKGVIVGMQLAKAEPVKTA